MSTTQTTANDGNARPSSAQWSDLPDDLLGNISLRIASPRDRVRLGAVCRPWRATMARLPAPPAVPLLLLSPRMLSAGKTYLCGGEPEDGWFLRIMDKLVDKRLVGSHDVGWVALFDSGSRELMLVNLFSGAEVGVCSPWPGKPWQSEVLHVVLSDGPTSSSGCIIAVITDHWGTIALCKLGCHSGWATKRWEEKFVVDITFCNGDLYGIAYPGEEIVKFEIDRKEDGPLIVKSTNMLVIQRRHGRTVNDEPLVYECYILELHGKPLKAVRAIWLPNRLPFFKVFEIANADAGEAYQHRWAEVTSFGNYALFLGQVRSKAMHVPVGSERRGFESNHIYYSTKSNLCGDEVYSLRLDDGRLMSCRKDQSIGDGLGRTGYFMMGWLNVAVWIHPPDL